MPLEYYITLFGLVLICLVYYLKVLYEWKRKVKISTIIFANKNNSNIKEQKEIVKTLAQAPGPIPWPILGSLAVLGKYEIPFEGFTALAKKYGDVYSMTLGTTRCLIVNNLNLIREVLNQNGRYFGGRPDFIRFHHLFGGDRNNSLALCDWSGLQQKRRNLARKHCSPREQSTYFSKMSDVGCFEMQELLDHLQQTTEPGVDFNIKPLIMQTCANMFIQYMCSIRFDYNDNDFVRIIGDFDNIFWEINQGYAVDFLPWLAPFYKKNLNNLSSWSTDIRHFILDRIVNEREQNLDPDEVENDFTDALLKSLIEDPTVTRDTIIYMLEDFIGGHSAIGNLIMLALGYIAKNPTIGRKIQEEADNVTKGQIRNISLHDADNLPYTNATIYEVLRYASSPIVPHVASEDACIAGFGVTKGTIVFINNYELNTSDKYWEKPEMFDPYRFLETVTIEQAKSERSVSESSSSDSGIENEREFKNKNSKLETKTTIVRVKKNIPHFLPFSIGKRTCIGQNLVRGFSFIMLANIIQRYDVSCSDLNLIKSNPACVAVPPQTYPLSLTLRDKFKQ